MQGIFMIKCIPEGADMSYNVRIPIQRATDSERRMKELIFSLHDSLRRSRKATDSLDNWQRKLKADLEESRSLMEVYLEPPLEQEMKLYCGIATVLNQQKEQLRKAKREVESQEALRISDSENDADLYSPM